MSAPSWPPRLHQNRVGLEAVLAQQTIPAFSDARHAPPMAPDADMRLALDDVTLADLQCQPDNAAVAVIAEHLVIPVELSPAGIVVTARPLRGRGSSWEWSMGNPTEFSGPTGLHDADLDDLPVRLVFEVGRVELSLGELERLAPGALVPLARPLDEPLDIMANGRRLGRGTLVRIGESLGVRIVSLVGNE
jgi:type III secretion protein Q